MASSFPCLSEILNTDSQFGDNFQAAIIFQNNNLELVFSLNGAAYVAIATGIDNIYPVQIVEMPDASIIVSYYKIEAGAHLLKSYVSDDGGDTWSAL